MPFRVGPRSSVPNQAIRGALDLDVSVEPNGYGEEDGIAVDRCPDPRATVDEHGLDRLRQATREQGLAIEIIETS